MSRIQDLIELTPETLQEIKDREFEKPNIFYANGSWCVRRDKNHKLRKMGCWIWIDKAKTFVKHLNDEKRNLDKMLKAMKEYKNAT